MQHKDEVEAQFGAYQPVTSELTFTNLWMWQNHYHCEVARLGGFLCFLARPLEGDPWCLPPVGEGDVRGAARTLLEHLRALGGVSDLSGARSPLDSRRGLERVPERLVKEQGLGPGSLFGSAGLECEFQPMQARPPLASYDALVEPFVAQLDRDQSDYVYLSRDLIELAGRDLHAKKNHVNRFKRTYRHEYRRLSADLSGACLAMETAWCDLRHCWETRSLASEEVAIHEALHHFGELSYLGGVILVEGKVEAFALGEALNPDTFVCHVEKANPDVDGLYAAINQMFCEAEAARFTYVNREQDLGVPGLRKAKESYQPHHLEHKYRVTESRG
jgi:hypothetical protein